MSPAQDPQGTCGDDIRLLLADLAVICGTLSEIATIWRRARPPPGVRPARRSVALLITVPPAWT
jgi:hypothetical protein